MGYCRCRLGDSLLDRTRRHLDELLLQHGYRDNGEWLMDWRPTTIETKHRNLELGGI